MGEQETESDFYARDGCFFYITLFTSFNLFTFEKAIIARSFINSVLFCEVAYENMLK